jgi:hypothetical protein
MSLQSLGQGWRAAPPVFECRCAGSTGGGGPASASFLWARWAMGSPHRTRSLTLKSASRSSLLRDTPGEGCQP